MKDANFEKDLKNRLDDYISPLDLEASWDSLDARRTKKKKRPIVWFWWGGLLVILLGLVSWYATNRILKNIALRANSQQEFFAPLPDAQEAKTNAIIAKDIDAIIKKTNVVSSLKADKITKGALDPQQQNIPSKLLIERKSPLVDDPKSEQFKSTKTNHNLSVNDHQNKGTKGQANDLALNRLSMKMSLLPLKLESLTIPKPNINWHFEEIPATKIQKAKTQWALGIYSGYGKAFRTLSTSQEDIQSFINHRNDAENILDSWYTSFNLRKNFKQSWFAEFGIGYAQTATRFQDVDVSSTSELLDNQLLSLTYKNDGTVNEAFGEALVEIINTTSGTYYQYDKSLFFQLNGGKNIYSSKNTGINISAGVNYSFYARKEGTVFSADNSNTYADLSDSDFRKSGLLNAVVQTEFYYLPFQNWEIALGLVGSAQLNNSFSGQAISEKKQLVAMQLGLRKNF